MKKNGQTATELMVMEEKSSESTSWENIAKKFFSVCGIDVDRFWTKKKLNKKFLKAMINSGPPIAKFLRPYKQNVWKKQFLFVTSQPKIKNFVDLKQKPLATAVYQKCHKKIGNREIAKLSQYLYWLYATADGQKWGGIGQRYLCTKPRH